MSRTLSLLVLLLVLHTVASQNRFQKALKTNSPETVYNLQIKFNDEADNSGYVPVSVLKGNKVGKVFTIIAGIHGYEYPPIIAVQEFLKEIDLKKLNGTLVVIPIANTASFFTRTPFVNPQDAKNLNTAFPGEKTGTITEKLTHFITTQIIPASDVFLDIHGGDACEDLIPFVCFYNNTEQQKQTALARKLAEQSGFEYVISYPYNIMDTEPAKYAFKQAVQDGKTALSIECGKLGNVQEENVNLIKNGVYAMLATMGMYSKSNPVPHPNLKFGNHQKYIKSTVQGIFYSDYKAGDFVKKGDVVGYTTNVFGEIIENYKVPMDGIILYKLATPPINIGDTVLCISSLVED